MIGRVRSLNIAVRCRPQFQEIHERILICYYVVLLVVKISGRSATSCVRECMEKLICQININTKNIDLCGLPTPWNCWYDELGLSSSMTFDKETDWLIDWLIVIGARDLICSFCRSHLEPSTSNCIYDCLSARFRHLRGNWKLYIRQHDDSAHLRTIYFDVREEYFYQCSSYLLRVNCKKNIT